MCHYPHLTDGKGYHKEVKGLIQKGIEIHNFHLNTYMPIDFNENSVTKISFWIWLKVTCSTQHKDSVA